MAKPLHKILSTLTICAALTLSFANPITAGTEASKSYPYTGAVSGDSVRLRTGPSTGHAIAGVVTKADELIVLEEKDGWLKIRMPASEQCWISKQFVTLEGDQAKVTAKNVNLRIRPNTNNVPVGQVSTSTLTAVTEKGSVVPAGESSGRSNGRVKGVGLADNQRVGILAAEGVGDGDGIRAGAEVGALRGGLAAGPEEGVGGLAQGSI